MFPPQVPSVDPAQVPAEAAILDVREPDEWEAGHVDGAVHIPLMELPARTGELPEGPDGQVYVICRSGGRSARAVAWLGQNGFDAVNVDGGMGAWQAVGREMVSETGEAPTVR
ncbi:rhodanese-like domain-containing protein [Kineosporia babensis]|uniref:Rhodanese-like domain-containing protein n=1 Tax=Kineosporia babensis TaxID=499548 RepID=A0A9X1NIF2_9ACTN|nr:rhodanese-like domain-containing protein [Kineosporia babensis]MCD5314645.1 rhodanese-like domain-containing protein [Kineosporia babensis]